MKKQPKTIDLDTGKIVPEAPDASPALVAKIESINVLHRQAQATADAARQKTEEAAHLAILVGLRLRALRPQIPHGGWEKLFAPEPNKKALSNRNHGSDLHKSHASHESYFEFSARTALKYIAAAEGVLENRLTRKKALALEGLAAKETLDEPAKKLLNEASRGETLRQLYLDLGIIRPTQQETIDRNRNTKGGPTKEQQRAKHTPEEAEALANSDAVEATARLLLAIDGYQTLGHALRLSRASLGKLRAAVSAFSDHLATIRA
jgi:hypothetical protein